VRAHDRGDELLSPPGSLGTLDRTLDRVLAIRASGLSTGNGRLVIAAADHPVTHHKVSAYPPGITRVVTEASVAGVSVGAVAAARAGLGLTVVDAGVDDGPVPGAHLLRPVGPKGDLVAADAMNGADAAALLAGGARLAGELCRQGADLIALGEIGVGNTTVAAALATCLLDGDPDELVGLGAGSDSAMVAAKRRVVRAAVARAGRGDVAGLLGAVGGGEISVLAGVVLGGARGGAVIVLDGLATGVAALAALRLEPAVAAHLVAGQRSRETAHDAVLAALGLEPLLDLRLRAGEGVGASLAVGMLRTALEIRLSSARTGPGHEGPDRRPARPSLP
jgi:nicotinate-nucleotide--dimethylbenzimidazole phosphoribosyltransferase